MLMTISKAVGLSIASWVVKGTVVALLFIATMAHADVVELKNGQRTEGTLKQVTSSAVTIEVGGQIITFKAEQVRAIYYGAGPTATAPASPSSPVAAIRALKALQSATAAGLTYRDYGPRLADTQIEVDRYLDGGAAEDPPVAPIRDAMELYVFAGRAWSAKFTRHDRDYYSLATDPIIQKCPALLRVPVPVLPFERAFVSDAVIRGAAYAEYVPTIWQCASEHIGKAEASLVPVAVPIVDTDSAKQVLTTTMSEAIAQVDLQAIHKGLAGALFAETEGLDGPAVIVVNVDSGSAAAVHGLQVNDVITAINSVGVHTVTELRNVAAKQNILILSVHRGNEDLLLQVR